MAYPYRHEKETRVLSEYFGDPEARNRIESSFFGPLE